MMCVIQQHDGAVQFSSGAYNTHGIWLKPRRSSLHIASRSAWRRITAFTRMAVSKYSRRRRGPVTFLWQHGLLYSVCAYSDVCGVMAHQYVCITNTTTITNQMHAQHACDCVSASLDRHPECGVAHPSDPHPQLA